MKLDLADILILNQPLRVAKHPLIESIQENPIPEDVSFDDPLQASVATESDVDFVDPLGVYDLPAVIDQNVTNLKLSKKEIVKEEPKLSFDTGNLVNTLEQKDEQVVPDLDPSINDFTPWSEMKKRVLIEFTATDQLSLESKFLSKDVLESVEGVAKNKSKKKNGDDVENLPVKLVGLSQSQFEDRMNDFRKLLLHFWKCERRMDCIQLAVEIARLLSSVSVPQYYPSLFVHVTDFLDIFGNLVYERLLEKAKEERKACRLPPLSSNFGTIEVLEQTKITARNWFGKIQEIKHVLPRIYVEIALLKCMKFMDDTAIMANLMRMGTLARSLQHPLVSNYARCYICRVAMRLDSTDRSPNWLCLNDWMQTYTNQPVFLLWPALEYIVQCVSHGAVTFNDLLPLWEYCSPNNRRTVLLCSFLNGISRFYLAEHALEATKLVVNAEEVTPEELSALGRNLCSIDVDEKDRKPILRLVWKCINRLVPVTGFLTAFEVWVEFIAKYFTENELGIVLDQVVRMITPNKLYEHHYNVLIAILTKIMEFSKNISAVLQLDIFVKFIDLFRNDLVRKESSTVILMAFIKKTQRGFSTNWKLANQIIEICKKLHDSVNVFSTESEVLSVTLLVKNALDRFQLEVDPERSLEFLVFCRSSMMNIDQIQKYIIERLLSITLNVIRRSRFSTARTAFLHSCVTNLFITIPSINNPADRIRLNIHSGQVALAAEIFHFLESFLQAAVDDFGLLTNGADLQKLSFPFLSLLISTPDPLDDLIPGPMAIFSKFLDVVQNFAWPKTHSAEQQKGKILLAAIQALLFRRRLYDCTIIANSWNSLQFKWIDRSQEAKHLHAFEIDQNIARSADALAPILNADQKCELSLQLVEIVARFGVDEMVESLAILARDGYKKCKKIPEMQNRLAVAKQIAKS